MTAAGKKKRPARKPKALDPGAALIEAVGVYVKSKGGSVLVGGPIQLLKWPGDLALQFTIAIRCTGQRPVPDSPISELTGVTL